MNDQLSLYHFGCGQIDQLNLSVWVVKGKPYKKIELKDLITKIGKGLKRKR
jgi:hypothetical protein